MKQRDLPRLWLFTDPRISKQRLLQAIAHLPRGSGIVFRHYELETKDRRLLINHVLKLARRRRVRLLFGESGKGPAPEPRLIDGWHLPGWRRKGRGGFPRIPGMLLSMSAHSERDIIAARRAGADLIFLSPAFPTQSHPGARTLGAVRFGMLARQAKMPVIALGGITSQRFRKLRPLGAHGWAAINALS